MGSWTVNEGITDPSAFFAALSALLPEATHLEIEGERLAPDVRALYAAHDDGSPVRSPRQMLSWARSYRCQLSTGLLSELARLSCHRAPEAVAQHLAVFEGERQLLFWHDAFANAFVVGPEVAEERVAAFAAQFGVTYDRP